MWIGSQAELTLRLPGLGTPQYRGLKGWARRVSNLRPLACEASALPLSYAPWQGVSLPPRFAAPRLEGEFRHEPAAARAAHGHAAGAGRAHAPVREGEALQGRGRRGEPQRVAPRRRSLHRRLERPGLRVPHDRLEEAPGDRVAQVLAPVRPVVHARLLVVQN